MSKKAPKAKPVPSRTYTKPLRVDLTKEEREQLAIGLAGHERELNRAKQAKKEMTAQVNATVKACEAVVHEVATVVNQGWELRDVEVDVIEDWDAKVILEVRRDTAVIIRQRPMTEEERQRPLPMSI